MLHSETWLGPYTAVWLWEELPKLPESIFHLQNGLPIFTLASLRFNEIIYIWKINWSVKEINGNFFQVKFEDFNQKKHLRDFWELCLPLGVKTQLCKFLGTEGYMLDNMIDSLCNPDISIMWPLIRLRRIVIFSGIVWLMLGEYRSLWLSRYFCQWRRFG